MTVYQNKHYQLAKKIKKCHSGSQIISESLYRQVHIVQTSSRINFTINPTFATKSGGVFYPEFVYAQPHVYSVPVDRLADDRP